MRKTVSKTKTILNEILKLIITMNKIFLFFSYAFVRLSVVMLNSGAKSHFFN